MSEMRALVLEQKGGPFVWHSVERPVVERDEVLVDVKANGLCGTDLKILDGQVSTVTMPAIIGHELSGVVIDVGSEVSNVAVGDNVVVHIYVGCMTCKHCRLGFENRCPDVRRLGFEIAGGFAEVIKAPSRNVLRVDPKIPLEEVAILSGSIATPFHGLRTRARISLGDWVALIGVGGLGIHALQLARELGGRMIAVDVTADKLEKALELGAEAAIDASHEDVPARIRALTGGRGADVVVEIVGGASIPPVLATSFQCLAQGGRLLVLGYGYGYPLQVDTAQLVYGQWEIQGSRSSAKQDLADVVELVERGRIKPIIAKTFPLDQVVEAMHELRTNPPLGRIVLV
ncbi:MAG TPA: alcohol dehydrogenase catalytic domain-containing protein [Candidatus Acidoferrales bacterium]|nr:alcohol dehydrogenase catalytic domain-containing protein [Candidatus Acidoferrales bacterium]